MSGDISGNRSLRSDKKYTGGTAFWGRVCSNSQNVQFRADLRGDVISFGRSSQCDATLPPLLWISGEHFVIHYIVPPAASKKLCKSSSGIDDDDEDDDRCCDDGEDAQDAGADDDDDDDEPYVEIEDKSRFGTWLNTELIGKGSRMRAQDGDKINLYAPSRHAHSGRIEAVSLVLRILNRAERNKQRRFLISKTHPINKEYNVLNTLGEGQYSIVYEAIEKATGRHVAVKVVSEETTLKTPEKTEAAMRNIQREMNIMRLVKHPCCIQIFNYLNYNRTHCFVLELAGVDLFDFIKTNGALSEGLAQCLFVQVLAAIKYLHHNNIIHRDMKPENILLVPDGDCLIAKVTDFGLARTLEENQLAITLCGTPLYVSPEIIKTRDAKSTTQGYGASVDMWSIGAILYTMLSATTPFNDKDPRIYQHILNGAIQFPPDRWGRITPDAINVVQGLMTVDVSHRMTSSQCMASSWCMQGLQHLSNTHSVTLVKLAREELAEVAENARRERMQEIGIVSSTDSSTSAYESGVLKRSSSMMQDSNDSEQTARAPKRPHIDVTSPVEQPQVTKPTQLSMTMFTVPQPLTTNKDDFSKHNM